MPEVMRACSICGPTDDEILAGRVIVSPNGVAHHSDNDGDGRTDCGKDATGEHWWWPL